MVLGRNSAPCGHEKACPPIRDNHGSLDWFCGSPAWTGVVIRYQLERRVAITAVVAHGENREGLGATNSPHHSAGAGILAARVDSSPSSWRFSFWSSVLTRTYPLRCPATQCLRPLVPSG